MTTPRAMDLADVSVDPKDLQSNGKLLSDTHIQWAIDQIGGTDGVDGYYVKDHPLFQGGPVGLAYDVVRANGHYYALYLGPEGSKAIARSDHAVVSLAQNLRTGAWVVAKIYYLTEENIADYNLQTITREISAWRAMRRLPALANSAVESKGETPTIYLHDLLQMQIVNTEERSHQLPQTAVFIMDYVAGESLADFIARHTVTEVDLQRIIANMQRAVHELFALGYTHGRINLKKFLVNPKTLEVNLVGFPRTRQINKRHDYRADDLIALSASIEELRKKVTARLAVPSVSSRANVSTSPVRVSSAAPAASTSRVTTALRSTNNVDQMQLRMMLVTTLRAELKRLKEKYTNRQSRKFAISQGRCNLLHRFLVRNTIDVAKQLDAKRIARQLRFLSQKMTKTSFSFFRKSKGAGILSSLADQVSKLDPEPKRISKWIRWLRL